ncbi:hypothetical protein N0V82_008464 [Gnomoniopsis sp. IMI 355080]|nr:hypothetical protein N0V82_008464 [Gnomoniopsis sp. IMI 355080]
MAVRQLAKMEKNIRDTKVVLLYITLKFLCTAYRKMGSPAIMPPRRGDEKDERKEVADPKPAGAEDEDDEDADEAV